MSPTPSLEAGRCLYFARPQRDGGRPFYPACLRLALNKVRRGSNCVLSPVRNIVAGQTGWLSKKISARLQDALNLPPDRYDRLTHREKEVLAELAEGKSNDDIGDTLGISPKTVEKHMEAIFKTIGVASRVEAAVWALHHDPAART